MPGTDGTLSDLSNATVLFLFPQNTSGMQFYDVAIIAFVKVAYERKPLTRETDNMDARSENGLDILTALSWIKLSWDSDSSDPIIHCLEHCLKEYEESQQSVEVQIGLKGHAEFNTIAVLELFDAADEKDVLEVEAIENLAATIVKSSVVDENEEEEDVRQFSDNKKLEISADARNFSDIFG